MSKKYYTDVSCSDCGKYHSKRIDTLKEWSGRCKSCAMKEVANRPYIRKAASERARKMVLQQGGIKNANHFTSETMSGENHWNWKGGITPKIRAVYSSKEYKEWRWKVFHRDDFVCQDCGERGGKLHAHHVIPVSIDFDKMLDVDNGQTLCASCHARKHMTMRWAAKRNDFSMRI